MNHIYCHERIEPTSGDIFPVTYMRYHFKVIDIFSFLNFILNSVWAALPPEIQTKKFRINRNDLNVLC